MKEFLKGFALGVSMLTTIPFFKVHHFTKGINGYSVLTYPLIGFFLGFLLYGVYLSLTPFIPALHLGVIIFALWVYLTGALHLDGFCDTVDGLYVPKEKSLEVMKDPHNGGMGMIFGGVFLLLKASSLAVFELFYLLPIILLLARLIVVISIYFFPYVSLHGMGSLAKEELKLWQVLLAILYSLLLVSFFDAWVLLLLSLILIFGIKQFFIKRYGGFTGDIYGFSIELIELVLLNAVIIGFK
jgi:cobalamin 5'-phosphate synthase/cobalamin synthase